MKSEKSRLLINSLPKSGTHLVSRAAELLGYKEHFSVGNLKNQEQKSENGTELKVEYSVPIFLNYGEIKNLLKKQGMTPQEVKNKNNLNVGALTSSYLDVDVLRKCLSEVPQGCLILGHIPWDENLSLILSELNFRHLFIIRDPRPVITSLVSFILDTRKMPKKHFLEKDFRQMTSFQRFEFLFNGGYAKNAGVEIKKFADVCNSMAAWKNDPNCLFLRFEDLIGEKGGGSSSLQLETIKKIAAHLEIPFENIANRIGEVYNPGARTFRTGQVAGWEASLGPDLSDYIKENCAELCRDSGYL
jgi:hypothetical protein